MAGAGEIPPENRRQRHDPPTITSLILLLLAVLPLSLSAPPTFLLRRARPWPAWPSFSGGTPLVPTPPTLRHLLRRRFRLRNIPLRRVSWKQLRSALLLPLPAVIGSSNSFSGVIGSQFGGLDHIKSLILSNNNLSGSGPAQLGKAMALQSFRTSRNNLRGSFLPSCSCFGILLFLILAYITLMDLSLAFLLVPLMAGFALEVLRMGPDELVALCRASLLQLDLIMLLCSAILDVLALTVYFLSRPRPVYLVDLTCYRPPFPNRVPFSNFMEHARLLPEFDAKSVEFQRRILERSGLGEETSFPPALHYIPPQVTMEESREEARVVIFSSIDQMLEKTGEGQGR